MHFTNNCDRLVTFILDFTYVTPHDSLCKWITMRAFKTPNRVSTLHFLPFTNGAVTYCKLKFPLWPALLLSLQENLGHMGCCQLDRESESHQRPLSLPLFPPLLILQFQTLQAQGEEVSLSPSSPHPYSFPPFLASAAGGNSVSPHPPRPHLCNLSWVS